MRYTIFTLLKPFFFFWIMSDPNGKEYVLQIQCIDAATMEREYTVLTSPTAAQILGYGPLGLGPRWIAYSGIPVPVPGTGLLALSFLGLVWLVPWRICLPGRSIRPQASKIGRLGTLPSPGSFGQSQTKQILNAYISPSHLRSMLLDLRVEPSTMASISKFIHDIPYLAA